MREVELNPDQIITLNDYPIYSDEALNMYFDRCQLGEPVSFVPVIEKKVVKDYLDAELLEILEAFEGENPLAEYFMLDGSHRTTALTLAGCKVKAMVYESDEDIIEAKKMVKTGQILQNGTLDHDFGENCEILNRHFAERSYFMTVEQKTEKLVREEMIPQYMIDVYTSRTT